MNILDLVGTKRIDEVVVKGEGAGHAFHGNQHTGAGVAALNANAKVHGAKVSAPTAASQVSWEKDAKTKSGGHAHAIYRNGTRVASSNDRKALEAHAKSYNDKYQPASPHHMSVGDNWG
jgi:hypothetical protein